MIAASAQGTGFPVSFEFFPPKTPEGAGKLRAARQQLYALHPDFCSVTYGAGGSTQQGSFDTVRDILAEGMAAGMAQAASSSTLVSWWPSSAQKLGVTFISRWRPTPKRTPRPGRPRPI